MKETANTWEYEVGNNSNIANFCVCEKLDSIFSKLPKLALLAFLYNFKWKQIKNSCQPSEFEYKFKFVKGFH